uniref:non-specific serine/threonine protein kinase n=2 Tax=Schistosoma mansoni TaxID=6183 RepID=A0A3Q0KTP5_SCHMA
MAEIDFLSAELENDDECRDDETDRLNLSSPGKNNTKSSDQLSKELICSENKEEITTQETVEICQKTVNPNNRVNAENFKIQRVIGKGGYGKVFLVQKVDGIDQGKLYAMKVLKKARLVCNEKDKAHTVSERNILEMLQHPFLVKLHYAFQNHSNLYIVLEYCHGGELFNYLEREGALLENAACFYASEIVLAIGHLHSLGIIYRDLKSENVLLDRQGHVKLTDFGLSKEGVCTTNTFCGTIEYMAPEIIRCEGHGKAVDWWSLGTLIYDMLSGTPPFSQEESREATTRKILTAPLKFPPSFSSEVISLIRGLLKRDPNERLGSKEDMEEIKRQKFFKRHEINWSDVYNRRLKPPFRPKLTAENDVSMFDPSFTRLQPVVSPVDGGASIPPDMFQGFSYVAPSVCEDSLRDNWTDNLPSRHRRHGLRGAMSAGRLRRIGFGHLNAPNRIPEDIVVHNIPLQIQPELNDFHDFSADYRQKPVIHQLSNHVSTQGSTNDKRTTAHLPDHHHQQQQQCDSNDTQQLHKMLSGKSTQIIKSNGTTNGNNVIKKEKEADEQEDDDDDDDEIAAEEEDNVPGAKQIQPTSTSKYLPLCKYESKNNDIMTNINTNSIHPITKLSNKNPTKYAPFSGSLQCHPELHTNTKMIHSRIMYSCQTGSFPHNNHKLGYATTSHLPGIQTASRITTPLQRRSPNCTATLNSDVPITPTTITTGTNNSTNAKCNIM